MLDRALLVGGLFEYIQVARMRYGDEPITEFMPFVLESSPIYKCPQYRNCWSLFTAILGTSRLLTYYHRERGVYNMNIIIHLLEVAFFISEAKIYDKSLDAKQKFLLVIIQAIPILSFLRYFSYTRKRTDEDKTKKMSAED